MRFPFYINPERVRGAYNNSRALLNGNESILFDSMNAIHQGFVLPANPGQYAIKNAEITRILSRLAIAGGLDLNFKLIDEILHRIILGGVAGVDLETFVGSWLFNVQGNCSIELKSNEKWLYKHTIDVRDLHNPLTHEYVLTLRDYSLGNIVPDYIIQYFHTALNCFSQNQYSVCLALSSIIVEGTLKDVLITRGYQFQTRGVTYVGGLGTALDRARNREAFLTSADFPSDLDDVIQPIRNNLVHLSGAAFSTLLPYLNGYDGVANFTLGHFVKHPILVHDMLQSVSFLVEKMYSDLRAAGHVIP